MQLIVNKIEELSKASEEVIDLLSEYPVVLLEGDLGAGKTTLVKQICIDLGVDSEVTSPTYNLINEYQGKEGSVYHMDLYRLKSMDEAFEIGIDDYLHSNMPCFIEWPEVIADLLPKKHLKIQLEKIEKESRKITIFKVN